MAGALPTRTRFGGHGGFELTFPWSRGLTVDDEEEAVGDATTVAAGECFFDDRHAERGRRLHAPQEAARILGEAADLARRGQVAALRWRSAGGAGGGGERR